MGNHLYRAMDEQAYRELAAGEGVGPSFTASKAAVLPLDDPAKLLSTTQDYTTKTPLNPLLILPAPAPQNHSHILQNMRMIL